METSIHITCSGALLSVAKLIRVLFQAALLSINLITLGESLATLNLSQRLFIEEEIFTAQPIRSMLSLCICQKYYNLRGLFPFLPTLIVKLVTNVKSFEVFYAFLACIMQLLQSFFFCWELFKMHLLQCFYFFSCLGVHFSAELLSVAFDTASTQIQLLYFVLLISQTCVQELLKKEKFEIDNKKPSFKVKPDVVSDSTSPPKAPSRLALAISWNASLASIETFALESLSSLSIRIHFQIIQNLLLGQRKKCLLTLAHFLQLRVCLLFLMTTPS